MSDHYFKIGDTVGIISLGNIFEYKGFTFENHHFCGPTRLKKKDFEPCKNPYGRVFLKAYSEWNKLSKKKKEKTRIYG